MTRDSFDSPDGRTYSGPETPAVTPGQAAYEAWRSRHGGPLAWSEIGQANQGRWEEIAQAAIDARQPQPAPGLPQSAYLYHCKFGGPGGDEYGLFWRKEDADAAAANRAGEGYTEVLGMAILGTRPEQPAPGEAALQDAMHALAGMLDTEADGSDGGYTDGLRYAAERIRELLPQPEPFRLRLPKPTPEQLAAIRAELDDPEPAPGDASGLLEPLHALAAKWDATAARNQRNGQSLVDQGDEYGNEGLAVAEALGACVVDLRAVLADAPEPQPAPGLAAAMAETRQLRTALRTLASLWDASSDKDEETGARPNRARLVFEERATVRRNCAADIRKLAGPEGK